MQARAMPEQLQDTAAQIRRARDRLRKQDARSQAKRGSLHMTLTQIIVACLLVQVCGDAGATAGLWIRHTKTRTRKQVQLMKTWEQHRLQLLAQLLHDERKAEATKWRYPPTQTYAQAAYDFLAESQLHAWLQRQNLEAGLAPTSEELVTEYARLWPHAGVPGIRNTALFVFAHKATCKRTWAQRWG